MSSTLRGGPAAAAVAVAGLALLLATGACGEDERPASFEYIQAAIIGPSCATASCHSAENAQAGLRLHDVASSYSILTGHACGGNDPDLEAPRNYVEPGHPERSRLMYLLLGLEVRQPMPPDRPLPGGDIDLVERWILEGARCN
jgi:hypothetical protein